MFFTDGHPRARPVQHFIDKLESQKFKSSNEALSYIESHQLQFTVRDLSDVLVIASSLCYTSLVQEILSQLVDPIVETGKACEASKLNTAKLLARQAAKNARSQAGNRKYDRIIRMIK